MTHFGLAVRKDNAAHQRVIMDLRNGTLWNFPVARARPYALSKMRFFIPAGMPGEIIGLVGRDFLSHFTFTCEGSTGTFRLLFTGEVASADAKPHS